MSNGNSATADSDDKGQNTVTTISAHQDARHQVDNEPAGSPPGPQGVNGRFVFGSRIRLST